MQHNCFNSFRELSSLMPRKILKEFYSEKFLDRRSSTISFTRRIWNASCNLVSA